MGYHEFDELGVFFSNIHKNKYKANIEIYLSTTKNHPKVYNAF